ncbi:MAG: hypothetical protein AB7G68_14930 [Nitrospiraceae bacterium]
MGNAKSFDKHFLEIEPTVESLVSSVAALVRSIPSLGMTATVLSGRTALGVVLGGLLWAAATPAPAQGLPQHMVAYMTQPGQTECPNNWTEAAYAQGRLILGTIHGSKVQAQAGAPASDAQLPQHVHTFTVNGTVAAGSNSSLPTSGRGVDIPRAGGGEVNSSGITDGTSLPLPFIQFLVCEQTAMESPDSAPYGTVAFFNASACPNNWAPLSQADGRFLLPAFAGGAPGYATSTAWDPANPPTHTHGLQASFNTQSQTYEAFPSNWVEFANPGTYRVAGTTNPAGPVLPFVSLLACEKAALGNSKGVPLGTAIFFGAENCPDGWGVTIGANGRFVMGIGGNGTQGATFGSAPISQGETSVRHDHGFSGVVSPPASAFPGGPKVPNYGFQSYVTTGGAGYGGTSSAATTELPYLVMQSCTYMAGQLKRPGNR